MSVLPVTPKLECSFNKSINFTFFIKDSFDTIQPIPAEGKKPYLLLPPNLEDPSTRVVAVTV